MLADAEARQAAGRSAAASTPPCSACWSRWSSTATRPCRDPCGHRAAPRSGFRPARRRARDVAGATTPGRWRTGSPATAPRPAKPGRRPPATPAAAAHAWALPDMQAWDASSPAARAGARPERHRALRGSCSPRPRSHPLWQAFSCAPLGLLYALGRRPRAGPRGVRRLRPGSPSSARRSSSAASTARPRPRSSGRPGRAERSCATAIERLEADGRPLPGLGRAAAAGPWRWSSQARGDEAATSSRCERGAGLAARHPGPGALARQCGPRFWRHASTSGMPSGSPASVSCANSTDWPQSAAGGARQTLGAVLSAAARRRR